ncbi:hypothetical protein ACIQMV_09255 [Streptomyces sp. NPDC091412]|uniref:hypothetical protein n=1 Tax=unclassified Streptomyces TaxID=2593676 RepID=UPI0038206154
MVFRSTWQDLQQRFRTYVLGDEASEPTDIALKAQAIQDERQTQNLIAIEKARGATQLHFLVALGLFALLALVIVLAAALWVVHLAKGLKLSSSGIRVDLLTFLGTSALSGLTWGTIRLCKRRGNRDATPASPSEDHSEGDQNQVGTP